MNPLSSSNTFGPVRRSITLAAASILFVAICVSGIGDLIVSVRAMGVSQSIIIQLQQEPAAIWKAREIKAGRSVSNDQLQVYRQSVRTGQDQFLAALQAHGITFQMDGVDVPNFDGTNAGHVDFRYTLVLNAVTLKVPAAAVSIIRSMPQVKKVEPNGVLQTQLEKSVEYVKAPSVYGQFRELTPFDTFNEGYEGQGINVAVLDTGIDWTNPMFGGDPTPPRLGLAPPIAAINSNQKVIDYMSFTGGLLDDYGHGSHAASDIAGYLGIAPGTDSIPGTLDDARLHGVAPQARLMGYKVCLAVGSCVNASTIMAIEDAVSPTTLNLQPKPIAHVINLSLGGAGGPNDSTSVAADNAALLGTTVVASAGNEGPGQSTIGSPAAGRHVIAVGANTDPAGGSNTIDVVSGERNGMIANLLDGAAAVTSDITSNYVFCGFAETPDQVPASVSGKIALIARGGTYSAEAPVVGGVGTGLFSNKAAFAFAKGAIAVVIYNNVDGELAAATVRASTIPVVGMSKSNGEFLKSLIGSEAFGAVSAKRIRINKNKVFSPEMADFSSRGPVQGLGQVKPDVTAPGVEIYGATVRAGSVDTNTGMMFDPTGYTHASGTSFSGPHVAGAAALIKQAHLGWTPDMIRTALINTATNLRTTSGAPKADGQQADSIIAQGGGLIDVGAAVRAKALMGVEGDGIVSPGILGSHSFGEAPILNNRIVNTREVTVTIRDTSGLGGTYNLSTANNRYFDRPGITAAVSQSSVVVPAGGSATFTASITLDGNQVRDTSQPLELQSYVVARRAGSSETLRMPLYFKANPSVPGAGGNGSSSTEQFTGTIVAGDAGAQSGEGVFLADGITYEDVEFEVSEGTVRLDAVLEFTDVFDAGISDLDLYVLDPDGNSIATATIAGGPEVISAPITRGGTYTYRVYGWLAADTSYTLTSTQSMGGAAPVVNAIDANFVQQSTGDRYDFDGSYNVSWTPTGSVENYEVEESVNGGPWNVARTVAGNVNSISVVSAPNGTYSYRVRSIVPGSIGKYVTLPSNVSSIIVARRTEVDATASIDALNRSIVFPAGATEIVTALKNNSATTYFPNIRFEIISVQSSGNSVRVANADNGGNGVTSTAVFDYSQLVGSDLIQNEESGNRMLRFNNPNTVLFTFTARVMANVAAGGGSGFFGGETTSGGTTQTDGKTGTAGVAGATQPRMMKFSVNPLTNTISPVL